MRIGVLLLALVVCLLGTVSAAEFKVYPGAKLDEQATKQAMDIAAQAKQAGKSTIYTTKDSFKQVALFYKGLGKEFSMPRSSGISGQPKKYEKYELWEAYFILDGAQDLSSSKRWVKIQRPYIGAEVKDLTAIISVEK
jgi:hypothetical protein